MLTLATNTLNQIEDKVSKDYQELINGVKKVVADPEAYQKFLDFYTKLPTRSFRNQMLIYSQREDATFVAGFKAWNKFGRKVNKGAKAIKIIAPRTKSVKELNERTGKEEKTQKIVGFQRVNVFDVKDTNGVPLPLNPIMPKNVPASEFAEKAFKHLVNEFEKDLPITLNESYEGSSNGFYTPSEHRIELNARPERDITNQQKTLIHEYAHAIFHKPEGKYHGYDKKTKELQAESVAYITCKNFGMDTSDYSFPYIKGWASEHSENLLLEYQSDIQKESAKIIKRIEDVIVEKEITFDIGVVLDENMTPAIDGEQKVSLIQYGNQYGIVKGDFSPSVLNNLEDIKAIGHMYDDKELAKATFEQGKGYLPLDQLNQIDKEKGNTHIFERDVIDPLDLKKKKMYAIGVKSLTNIKLVSNLSSDLGKLKKQLAKILDGHSLTKKNPSHDLGTRDTDQDGLTDLEELKLGTNPYSSDTDNDGIPDYRDSHPRTPNAPKNTLERKL